MKKCFIVMMGLAAILFVQPAAGQADAPLPDKMQDYIRNIRFGEIGDARPAVEYKLVKEERDPGLQNGFDTTGRPAISRIYHVTVAWNLKDSVRQDDIQITVLPSFPAVFHWAPHLTPTDEYIIAQHVFRAPALIAASEERQLILVPDLDILKKGSPVEWYMDMNAPENRLTLGLGRSQVREHVLYTRKAGAVYPPGRLSYGFYILTSDVAADLNDPWRRILSFFWQKWGSPLYKTGEPLMHRDMEPYVKQTYNWAFNSWKKAVWQEFTLNGKQVGAPVFIVNVTQSPDWPGPVNEREFRSIWNQAWFSSLRSAEGLFRYARTHKDSSLMKKALETKELALSFPQRNGFFCSVIATAMEQVEVDGKFYNRSSGWDTRYFGNSNRNPYTNDAKESPCHLLDMSYTAFLMLEWYEGLEKDKRLLDYATRYADALLKLQSDDGFFPGWLSLRDLQPLQHLNQSPESAMSVTFLLKMFAITGNGKYRKSALRCMNGIIREIIPKGRWEDFETYWSCSRYGSTDLVGRKVKRNDMYKQNTLSMYWTAQALYACYRLTGEKRYLSLGQRTLDEMLMSQATWQPPFMYVNVLGGFGVMNADGEWNDSRQSLFAELIVQYGKELNNREYIERGIAALRASFVMMYSPANPRTRNQWEKKWKFFGPRDYGFMMENYGHTGETSPEGMGIGEFTIYDWRNGAAAEAYNRMVDHFGKSWLLEH
jgi:hypothetical protein